MASTSTGGPGSAFSRRAFIGVAGGVAASTLLAACSRTGTGSVGSGSSGHALKFWNMPWGGATFNPLDKKITLAFNQDGYTGSYQEVQWANFATVFSTAVASNTGPAISSGGGTQAFLYAHQGKIAYADDLLDAWKKNGIYDDFLDGLVETLKTSDGYAAVPYNLDVRVAWYNKTLLQKAGAELPATWDDYKDVCAKLKKIGVYGFGVGSGAGNFTGSHVLTAFMINNGGGLFNAKQEPDAVTDRNIEAMEYILELVKNGYSDPASGTYTVANVQAQWKARKYGFGWDDAGVATNTGGDMVTEMAVADPLTGPHGTKGGLYFPNNIMMYKNTPSQKASEAFATYYYKHMAPLWTKHTGIGLPPLKSIAATKEFQSDPNSVKIINEWQPIFKTWAAPGGTSLFYNVANTVDSTAPIVAFTQSILGGKTDAKSALTTLQNAIEGLMK